MESAAQLTASGLSRPSLKTRHCDRRAGAAFTLVELLVVVGVIAVLSSLLAPAIQGLMGTSGRQGGLNTATAVLEQARLAAIENGITTYVGFPVYANKTNGFSHLIVFREAKAEDATTNPVALTRWQKLPAGVFFEPDPTLSAVLVDRTLPPRALPRLGTEDVTKISALGFNRFGQLQGVNQEVILRLGEKIDPGGGWRGGTNNHLALRVQPLTGRVIVKDMAVNP